MIDANPKSLFYFEVPGPFATKGSTMSFKDRRGIVRTLTDSKHEKTFTASVQWAAKRAGVTLVEKGVGVSLQVVYGFARPKGRDRGRPAPCVRPDVDKLIRALMDALTGVAYHDDGQVVALSVRKVYAPVVTMKVFIMADPIP